MKECFEAFFQNSKETHDFISPSDLKKYVFNIDRKTITGNLNVNKRVLGPLIGTEDFFIDTVIFVVVFYKHIVD